MLGPWIGAALSSLSLLLQAAFFNHGGFSSWGVNVLALGVGGAVGGWLTFKAARKCGLPIWAAGGLAGLVGDILTYVISGLALALVLAFAPPSHTPQIHLTFSQLLLAIFGAYLPVQGPISLGEAALTGLALHYIHAQRPEVLEALRVITPRRLATVVTATLLVLLAVGTMSPSRAQAPTPPPPATTPRGMDQAVNETLAEKTGHPAHAPYLNTERLGDIWNTLLLLGGGTMGFICGRYWHLLFERKRESLPNASGESLPAQAKD